jgi:hypothetical protein
VPYVGHFGAGYALQRIQKRQAAILVKPGCRATVPSPRTRSCFMADRCAEPESRDSGLVFGQ